MILPGFGIFRMLYQNFQLKIYWLCRMVYAMMSIGVLGLLCERITCIRWFRC